MKSGASSSSSLSRSNRSLNSALSSSFLSPTLRRFTSGKFKSSSWKDRDQELQVRVVAHHHSQSPTHIPTDGFTRPSPAPCRPPSTPPLASSLPSKQGPCPATLGTIGQHHRAGFLDSSLTRPVRRPLRATEAPTFLFPPISAITPEETAAHTDNRAGLQTAMSLGTKPSPQITPSTPTAQDQTQRQLELFAALPAGPQLAHMTRLAQNSPHKSPSPSGLRRGSRRSAPAQPWGLSSWGSQEKPPDSTWLCPPSAVRAAAAGGSTHRPQLTSSQPSSHPGTPAILVLCH